MKLFGGFSGNRSKHGKKNPIPEETEEKVPQKAAVHATREDEPREDKIPKASEEEAREEVPAAVPENGGGEETEKEIVFRTPEQDAEIYRSLKDKYDSFDYEGMLSLLETRTVGENG